MAVCGVVIVAATGGSVIKVSLLEAAKARLEAANRPLEKPCKRHPGTDPVLSVCTQGDWDRAASARPCIESKRLPVWGVKLPSPVPCGGYGLVAAQDGWYLQVAPPAAVNPNCRTHAPPTERRAG
ncbi:MAG: hypothetical protein V2A79_12680 [Planctomycetota bacterium]